jgi:hypothetical protein
MVIRGGKIIPFMLLINLQGCTHFLKFWTNLVLKEMSL